VEEGFDIDIESCWVLGVGGANRSDEIALHPWQRSM
jgi:hypothetical protein